jgi:hypothetical protein
MEKIEISDLGTADTEPVVSTTESAFAKKLERTSTMNKKSKTMMIGAIAAIALGLGTGYFAAASARPSVITMQTADTTGNGNTETAAVSVKVGQVFGAKDATAFKDPVEGIILPGGIGSEGSHHLVRPGGVSQNVYLTSSVLDIKMFENHKVKVWGETFKGQKAGWLMDVGRVEVLQLNAPLPDWLQQQQQKTTGAGKDN